MTFLATDRCDRCGAQAAASAEAPHWRGRLLFCAHHLDEFASKLVMAGAVIFDPRSEVPAQR